MKGIFFLFLFFLSSNIFAQNADSLARKNSLLAYPVAFRLPETRWGFGAAASYQFYIKKSDVKSPPSQVQFGMAYTQNKQLLIYFPYALWWDERKNNLSGELGYYDYSYKYFGIGYDNDASISESYEVKFPRLRANYLREIKKHIYAGARWWYEDYRITKTIPEGELSTGLVPGSDGNRTSGPGIVLVYDSRDNVYESRSGWYTELVYHNQSELVGSEFAYDRYRIDVRKYFAFGRNNSFALQGFGDFLSGSVPFSQMASIGGAKRMRGYYEGHFRDKNMLMMQVESRLKVSRRWGLALFGHSGVLGNTSSDFALKHIHSAAGMGLRYMFDPEKRLNIRLDYAISEKANLFYLTVGEAF